VFGRVTLSSSSLGEAEISEMSRAFVFGKTRASTLTTSSSVMPMSVLRPTA
jgi:hypothetical protein